MKYFITYIKEILYLMGESKKVIPWMLLLFFFASMLDFIGLWLIAPYITLIINPENFSEGYFGQILQRFDLSFKFENYLVILSVGLVIIFLVRAIASILIRFLIQTFTLNIRTKLQVYLLEVFQSLPYINYINRNSSEYIEMVNGYVGRYASGVLQSLLDVIFAIIIFLAVFILLAFTNIKILIFLSVFILAIVFLYDFLFRSKLHFYSKNFNENSKKMVKIIIETFEGLKEISVLGKNHYFREKAHIVIKDQVKSLIKSSMIIDSPRFFLEFVLIVFIVGIVLLANSLGADIESTLPAIGVFGVASLRLMPLANQITSGITSLHVGRYPTSSLYNDFKKFEKLSKVKTSKTTSDKQNFKTFKRLELEGLFFSYPNSKQTIFKNLNLSIKAGDYLAFIGTSGIGKTTLVDLLLGLLEPDKGKILFNGESLKECAGDLQNHVAYLPQEAFIIDDTLARNVALGIEDKKIDITKINQSIEKASLTQVVENLSEGINTTLGEKGIKLSGGQRQRIALARAFYHERSVLIMDESTSSLDSDTENAILSEVKAFQGEKTIITISHRTSVIQHCDHVFKIENGKLLKIYNN